MICYHLTGYSRDRIIYALNDLFEEGIRKLHYENSYYNGKIYAGYEGDYSFHNSFI